MGRLAGKVAFITGAARGQGRSHAVCMAEEGADVIISDICGPVGTSGVVPATPEDLAETVRLVEATGQRVIWDHVDVREPAQLKALAQRGIDELGRITTVVANAGILNWARTHELTQDQWQDVIDVNLTGAFNTVQAVLPHFLERGEGGCFIVISSAAGLKGQPFTLSYTAAKHGLVGVVNALAIEYGEYNIRANSIHQAGVTTPMGDVPGLGALIEERAFTVGPVFMNTMPVEMIDSVDVSNAVIYLASDEARYVTGMQMKIDAGLVGR
ncbi:MAG: mycofactocin-coupled SDR family oxidoreductase [Actinomycetia bacterium]|nr:mycofactocin-coupled SDR family oxidoreductase [Actinomycetes bacterium]HBU01676.1 SDR family mycofactocin-dependent oxidoreductase [Acidimicrobiaceae bacterium]